MTEQDPLTNNLIFKKRNALIMGTEMFNLYHTLYFKGQRVFVCREIAIKIILIYQFFK